MRRTRKELPKYKNAEEMLTEALKSALTKESLDGYETYLEDLQNQFPKVLGKADIKLAAIHIGCINQALFSYSWYVYIDMLGLGGINIKGVEMGIPIIRAWRNASKPDLGIYNHEYDENIDEYLQLATNLDKVANRDLSDIAQWFMMSIFSRKDWEELEKGGYYKVTSSLSRRFEELADANLAIYQAHRFIK